MGWTVHYENDDFVVMSGSEHGTSSQINYKKHIQGETFDIPPIVDLVDELFSVLYAWHHGKDIDVTLQTPPEVRGKTHYMHTVDKSPDPQSTRYEQVVATDPLRGTSPEETAA